MAPVVAVATYPVELLADHGVVGGAVTTAYIATAFDSFPFILFPLGAELLPILSQLAVAARPTIETNMR